MTEFDFIREHLAPLAGPEGLGLVDDAALLSPPAGHELVLTKDTLIEAVHFPMGMYGADVAERLLRTNLSDLADPTAADQFASETKPAADVRALLAAGLKHGFVSVSGADNRACSANRQRQRFLAIDVLSRLGRFTDHYGVPVIRR